ncbi:YidB family protein [Aquincola tertiaricarbonis]|uniref:YidB family protein n=1 Tax=Aquincola tertiaricarbonis TaxID=391953 RepID=UPI0012ECE537|nr:YidB family protein [Aquincola tertiaricarbonis]
MGLLDLAIGMLGNNNGQGAQGGGLGGALGGMLGGGHGGGQADLLRIVALVLSQVGQQGGPGTGGGLGALVEQFTRSGLGDVVSSWVGTGANQPVSPGQLGQVFGDDLLGRLTQQTGLSQGDLLSQLSQVLPQAVDQMTPQGQLPADGGLGEIGSILERFAR